MKELTPTSVGFFGGLFAGVAGAIVITADGGGLTPLLVIPLCGAFIGGTIGTLLPHRRR